MSAKSERFIRFDALYGGLSDVLYGKTVAVFGLGGVGGACVEALCRSGVGTLVLVDNDIVSESNINRQIIATEKTVGRKKTEVFSERIRAINPDCRVKVYDRFYTGGTEEIAGADFVADCIDTVSAKLGLYTACTELGIPVISSMGTGNKKDMTALKVAPLNKTAVCPLARAVRREAVKRNVAEGVLAVYSTEIAEHTVVSEEFGRHSPASAIFVPWTAGLMMANEIIKHFSDNQKEN